MIASVAKKLNEKEKGFTLIELLVVVVIIGILAAIAIPAFLNQRQGAWRAQVESDVSNARLAAETFSQSNNGAYDNLNDAALTANGFRGTADVTVKVTNATANGYTLTGTHARLTGKSYIYNSAGTTPGWGDSTGTPAVSGDPTGSEG